MLNDDSLIIDEQAILWTKFLENLTHVLYRMAHFSSRYTVKKV